MGKFDTDPTNELHMQHTCKSRSLKCNNQWIPSMTNSIPIQERHCPSSLGRQNDRWHLPHNLISYQQRGGKTISTNTTGTAMDIQMLWQDWREHLDLALQTKSDVQDKALKTNLRFLRNTCASGEIHQSRLSRQALPQLHMLGNSSASHAMPQWKQNMVADRDNRQTGAMAEIGRQNWSQASVLDTKVMHMRGDKSFAKLGTMSPKMMALARSQDIIWWWHFTEWYTLAHFYNIQNFHLAMNSSFLNGADWTKQFISRLLHISHLQWIFRNISFHDTTCGYLHNTWLEDVTLEIEWLTGSHSSWINFLCTVTFQNSISVYNFFNLNY